MKTWKRALALVLALVMALSLVALPSFAEGEETGGGNDGMPYIEENGHGGKVEKDGLVMSKTIKKTGDSQFLLTLEAFATGSTTTTTSTKPMDIVLVLDVSGSMDDYMETYSISPDGTYYYYDEGDFLGFGAGYKRAYYCSSCNGWYTSEHKYTHRYNGTRLTPKTSAESPGTQFYSDVTKMANLKTAVNGFIDSVAKKSPDSSIAIVKFAGNKRDTVGNDTYRDGGYTYNYSQIVQGLTRVNTGASSLQTAVNGLEAAGATQADYGMQHAQTIINSVKDNGHQKVVIMFTDGNPTSGNEFEDTVANNAIKASKSIKAAGATVYTIGCFGTTPSDTSDTGEYMNYVSSNYPNATSMTSGGAKADPANYYKTVSSAADLNNIFTDISQTIGGTTVTLGSTSVLRDVISDYFKLPEGADKNSITAYSVDCTAVNDDGTYTWSANRDGTKYSVTVEGKTINVTGFDYAANWVGKDTTTGKMHTPAKKLVVEIPIVPEQDATGSVKTNGDASGIYADSTVKDPVEKFPSPTVYIPYFTVTHVASTVDSATGANKGEVGASENYPLWCNKEFNLTSVVTANHLYGGTFNEETCTTVHNDVQKQGNPMKLNPTENATYYIWEVPDTYLRPFTFYVWQHVDGKKTVTKLYPLVGVDRTNYANVGFSVCWGTSYNKDNAVYIPSGCNELSTGAQAGTAEVYQYLLATKSGVPVESWYLQNGKATNYMGDITTTETIIDEGCIGGFRLDAQQFENFKSDGITYRPYWITLDGVRVDSVRSRTLTFREGSETPIYNPSQTGKYSAGYTYVNTPAAQTLSFRTCMLADDSQPVVDERLTVTVVDGSNTTQVKVAPNGSVRDQVAYQAPAGKVFAGWFADQAYTTPADLDQVTEDTTIYAKYVSDSYLDLDYSRTGLFRLRGVTLISAVDNPANYQASGFIVGDQKVDVSYASRYLIFKTPASLFGAARDAKLMLADKSLSGTGDLEVTPYWVTLDGTEVHGITHTLHYNTRTIWE